jgi:uncharacterized protein YjdB
MATGSTQQFDAVSTYSDSLTADVSSQVTWTSDTPAAVTISSTGLASAVAAGTANVTAAINSVTSNTVPLIVEDVTSIDVEPATPAYLAVGATQQFTATATFTDSSTEDISSQATWASDTMATATISSTGLATGVAAGTANITAAIDGVTSPAVLLTVTSP